MATTSALGPRLSAKPVHRHLHVSAVVMNVPIWETKSHRNPLFSLAAILQDEAGASDWYLPSKEWQEAKFTDVPGTR